MKKSLLPLVVAAVAVSLSACAPKTVTRTDPTYETAAADRFLGANRAAIDTLTEGMTRANFGDAPVLVATIVNVNDLRRSAPLGRTLSEQYSARLAQRGFNVKDRKLRGTVFVQEGTGELLLSREVQEIARAHNATAVLVGTYSAAANVTYVNLKLVRTADQRILRAHDYTLPNDRDVRRLLSGTN